MTNHNLWKNFDNLGRIDLRLVDVKNLDKLAAKVLFTYAKEMGEPTFGEIKTFFEKNYPELQPRVETAAINEDTLFLIVTAKKNQRPMTDASKMHEVVAGLKFLDYDMGIAWDVVKEGDNNVLQQVLSLNVEDLIKERARRMGRLTSPKKQKEISAGTINVQVGDKVKFWNNDRRGEGFLRAIQGPMVKIVENGQEITIPKDCIFKVTEHSKDKQAAWTEAERNYFQRAYGFPPALTDKLVNK